MVSSIFNNLGTSNLFTCCLLLLIGLCRRRGKLPPAVGTVGTVGAGVGVGGVRPVGGVSVSVSGPESGVSVSGVSVVQVSCVGLRLGISGPLAVGVVGGDSIGVGRVGGDGSGVSVAGDGVDGGGDGGVRLGDDGSGDGGVSVGGDGSGDGVVGVGGDGGGSVRPEAGVSEGVVSVVQVSGISLGLSLGLGLSGPLAVAVGGPVGVGAGVSGVSGVGGGGVSAGGVAVVAVVESRVAVVESSGPKSVSVGHVWVSLGLSLSLGGSVGSSNASNLGQSDYK